LFGRVIDGELKTMTDWDRLEGSDWGHELKGRLQEQYWVDLKSFIEETSRDRAAHPLSSMIFSALHLTPPGQTKVVIVGQDPYPGDGQANGLAFSVDRGQKIPRTLANIYRELHCDVCVSIPSHGDLEAWAHRGVLLLNSTMTVRAGQSARHRKTWAPFTDAVIQIVDRWKPVYILWGQVAQMKALALIDESRRTVIKSPHPSPLSAYKGFFESKPFSRANQALIEANGSGIDWRLPD
jgi:uracil-DNA glycosylase